MVNFYSLKDSVLYLSTTLTRHNIHNDSKTFQLYLDAVILMKVSFFLSVQEGKYTYSHTDSLIPLFTNDQGYIYDYQVCLTDTLLNLITNNTILGHCLSV